MLALTGFVAVVVVALLLLYGVYVHHAEASPYGDDDRSIVRLDVKFAGALS